jgi:hypothetical protein
MLTSDLLVLKASVIKRFLKKEFIVVGTSTIENRLRQYGSMEVAYQTLLATGPVSFRGRVVRFLRLLRGVGGLSHR